MMFKFIIVAIVIIGAVTTIPPVRSRVMPPLAKLLGPTAAKIALPVKKYHAQNGCRNLLRELTQARSLNKPIPEPGMEFYNFARRATNDVNGDTDPWGNRYFLQPGVKVMAVGSPGPDGSRGTADDIVVSIPWE